MLDSKQKNKDSKNFHNISAYSQHQKYYLNIIDEHPLEIKSPDTHFSTFMNYLFAAKGYLLQRHRGIFCNLAKIKLKEALLATHCTGCP